MCALLNIRNLVDANTHPHSTMFLVILCVGLNRLHTSVVWLVSIFRPEQRPGLSVGGRR